MIRFVPWSEVGTITVSPGNNVVDVGAFELAEGADTLWVRMTNTGAPGPWPWSYGILSFRTDEGQPLGSIKAYNSFDGEVFKLGVGLPPSVRSGVLTFEPRGFNMAWIRKGNPWTLKFEAQSGGPNLTSSMWERDPANGVITPKVEGDNLDMTPGWIKAKNLILTNGSGASDDRTVPGYQQGTWAPSLRLNGSDFGVTYAENAGWYVRTGNLVTLWGSIALTSKGSQTGLATIDSLPYVTNNVSAGTSLVGGGNCFFASNLVNRTEFPSVSFHRTNRNLRIFMERNVDATDANFVDDTGLKFTAVYTTSDTTWAPVNSGQPD